MALCLALVTVSALDVAPSCTGAFTDSGPLDKGAASTTVGALAAYAHQKCAQRAIEGCCYFVVGSVPDGFDHCAVASNGYICDTDGDPCYHVNQVVDGGHPKCCQDLTSQTAHGSFVAFSLESVAPFSSVSLRLTATCSPGTSTVCEAGPSVALATCTSSSCDDSSMDDCSPRPAVTFTASGEILTADISADVLDTLAAGSTSLGLRLTAPATTHTFSWPTDTLCTEVYYEDKGRCDVVDGTKHTGVQLIGDGAPALIIDRSCTNGRDCGPGDTWECILSQGITGQCGECSDNPGAPCTTREGANGFCCGSVCAPVPFIWADASGDGRPPGEVCGSSTCSGTIDCSNAAWVCSSTGNTCCKEDAVRSCSTAGVCDAEVTTECAPYLCTNGSCATTCVDDDGCANGYACIEGACRQRCSSTLTCAGNPCVDTNSDAKLDACMPCASGGQRCGLPDGGSGFCCGGSCKVPPFNVDKSVGVLSADVGCGTGQCAGKALCTEDWLCDTKGTGCCTDDRQGACTSAGSCETKTDCNPFRCDGNSCATSCTDYKGCTTGCCAGKVCVAFGSVSEGDPCLEGCQCATGLCDKGVCRTAPTCIRADECESGLCVEGVCRDTCGPDGATCRTLSGVGNCCAGSCLAAPTGLSPDGACGAGNCTGTVICRGTWICSSNSTACCSTSDAGSSAAGSCSSLGECLPSEVCLPGCDGVLFLVRGCSAGACTPVKQEVCTGRCTSEGCVGCLETTDCPPTECEGTVLVTRSCVDTTCIEEEADCGADGLVCTPDGCTGCKGDTACTELYGEGYACHLPSGTCRLAVCRSDDECPGTCANNTFVPGQCHDLVCVQGEPVPCTLGEVCSLQGCTACTHRVNCSIAYGLGRSCVAGRCVDLCGDGTCDAEENCRLCPPDCGCPTEIMCDPLATQGDTAGCVGDEDDDGIIDSRDPRPRDGDNICARNQDCQPACYTNVLYQFRCVNGGCTILEKTPCSDEHLVCDPVVGTCGRCSDDGPCRTLIGPHGQCFKGTCLPDSDEDGVPDTIDPCRLDPTNTCTIRCGDELCDDGEDCVTCPQDCGCDDGNHCTKDVCDPDARICANTPLPCGSGCGGGNVCDGRGGCGEPGGEAASCGCTEVCRRGLMCLQGSCIVATCGDGKCENECGVCPEDCPPSTCAGDGTCDPTTGEDCLTSADCACTTGDLCDPRSPLADVNGCVGGCGDGRCHPDECAFCAKDCSVSDCSGNGVCDTAIGESCTTSNEDCVCHADVNVTSEVESEAGTWTSIPIQVHNDGTLADRFVIMVSTSLDSKWERVETSEMEPNATQFLTLEVQVPEKAGRHPVRIRITPKSDPSSEVERTVMVESAVKGWLERTLEGTILGWVLDIKDLLELVFIIVSLAGAVVLAFRKRGQLARSAQTGAPAVYNQPQSMYNNMRYYGPYYR